MYCPAIVERVLPIIVDNKVMIVTNPTAISNVPAIQGKCSFVFNFFTIG